ncbi:unnamed protein product [Linum tenue]|uniref:Uncharacterized protein n=1 Tax=Linum tenue TaxID=586396 RepID=A0AAV0KSH3_9ROSI|nr:unnamed protein product [Linum tenue]
MARLCSDRREDLTAGRNGDDGRDWATSTLAGGPVVSAVVTQQPTREWYYGAAMMAALDGGGSGGRGGLAIGGLRNPLTDRRRLY